MCYIIILFTCLSTCLLGDIQKNKIVKETITISENGAFVFKPEKLTNNVKAFKTAVDVFYERYKDESIDGFIAMNENAFSFASCLGYLKKVPVFKVFKNPHYIDVEIKDRSKYIIVTDILDDGAKIKPIIEWIDKNKAFVMEVCCLTEDLKQKGRENIQAQVMSVFLIKETRK